MRRKADAGFTLMETLVALAVLALSAVALLGSVERHVARITRIESLALAQWAAENHLTERSLGLPGTPGSLSMLGHQLTLTEQIVATLDPELWQLKITARTEDGSIARLTGFVALAAEVSGGQTKGIAAP